MNKFPGEFDFISRAMEYARKFHVISALELQDYSPAHDWLISGFFENNAMVMLFGDPGAGKSLLALDWAISIATGHDWCGYKTRQGGVFYLAGEGFRGIKRRLAAWVKTASERTGQRKAVTENTFWKMPFFLCEGSAGLPHGLDAISQTIDSVAIHCQPPSLVVIDTLARCLVGNENSADDMGAFVGACDTLRRRFGATVLVVHHSGHTEKNRARGYSSLPAAMDVIFQLEVLKDGERKLSCTKSKDFEPPDEITFAIKSICLPDGQPGGGLVTAPVLARCEMAATTRDQPEVRREHHHPGFSRMKRAKLE